MNQLISKIAQQQTGKQVSRQNGKQAASQATNRQKSGFTLIELMLSMGFVSVLLLAIAFAVINMATTYNRGITLKEVNQVTRELSSDFSRTVAGSTIFKINAAGNTVDTDSYVNLRNTGKLVGGRLCTGTSSYIWNTAFAIEKNYTEVAKGLSTTGTAGDAVHLYKVEDVNKKYCSKDASGNLAYANIAYTDYINGSEMLKAGDRMLGLEDFQVLASDVAQDTTIEQKIYTIQYRIGTGETSAMNNDQTQCLPPTNINSNWAYCNIQQFAIVVRAGNTMDK